MQPEYRLYQYETDALLEQFSPYRDASEGDVIRPRKGQWVVQLKDRLGYWRNHEGPFDSKPDAEAKLRELITKVLRPEELHMVTDRR